jgi:predicted metalloprotease with PDZ domain
MIRAFLTAATAVLLLGAAPAPATVDYRLGVEPQKQGLPVATVEIRLQGDADGETRLQLPDAYGSSTGAWRYLYGLQVKGATVTEDGPAAHLLRHKPNARLTVTYRVRSAYEADPYWKDGLTYKGAVIRPTWFASRGDLLLARPEGRDDQAARFKWGKLPKGWTVASDLDHGAMGQPMTVADVEESVVIGGVDVAIVQRPVTGGTLRVASLRSGPIPLDPLADEIAPAISAQRSYWGDISGPFFVAAIPLVRDGKSKVFGGNGLGDGFVLWSTPDEPALLRWTIAHEHAHTWVPRRVGRVPPEQQERNALWFTEGFTDFFTSRTMLRAGRWTPEDVVGRLDEALKAYDASPVRTAPNSRIAADFWKDANVYQLPHQRGQLLALKWDEDIRKKTGGKADLDDVMFRMRDHYRQFPRGQEPDVVTGLVSAAWVVAQVDLRPDIAKYVDRGETITFPEIMFDGCLDARVNVSPGFDSGFDHAASAAAKVAKGVRRRGPAWNTGLRDGMRLDGMDLRPGDMSREIVLTVRPANGRGRPRTLRYWPYGDVDVQTRTLQLAFGLSGERLAACGRKIAGV